MKLSNPPLVILDPLYGEVKFDDALSALASVPAVQRLRHVRLSNIDSIDIPSIANLSRYEHVLGVAHLTRCVGLRNILSSYENLALQAAGLLHDWAITAYGHLVEEGLQYVGTKFNHESRVKEILQGESIEIGGVNLQILAGREAGVSKWARAVIGPKLESKLVSDIILQITGGGKLGRLIAGDIDLDNMDNVFRMAFHMGLPIDRSVPARLASTIVGINEDNGNPIFKKSAEPDIEAWRTTRHQVYQHLMLSERDFTGKLMMLYAIVRAYQTGQLAEEDWNLIDSQFIERLSHSDNPDVRETVLRWMTGELWECTDLVWVEGNRPHFSELLQFSDMLSNNLRRTCFAYGIKDKRNRKIMVTYEDRTECAYGKNADKWLLGIGSPKRNPFTIKEKQQIRELIGTAFEADVFPPHSIDAGARLL